MKQKRFNVRIEIDVFRKIDFVTMSIEFIFIFIQFGLFDMIHFVFNNFT